MAADAGYVLQQLDRCLSASSSAALPDAVLLARFLAGKAEDAFAALVARHGPMVQGICCRVLRDAHAAEDVTQATFLVLARKARTIRRPAALASWLHRTAYHLALVARTAEGRRRARELHGFLAAPSRPATDPLEELTAREFVGVLDEELNRLPARYRLPLLLCCLEGRTQEEAAQQLGWTVGSMKGRLTRGRAKLQQALKRRGLALSAVLLAVEATRPAVTATRWASFIRSTGQAAVTLLAPTAGTSAPMTPAVAALVEQGLRGLAIAKGKFMLVVLLACSALAASIGVLAHEGWRSEPPAAPPRSEPKQQARATPEKEQSKEKSPARTDVYGDPLPAGARARLGTVRLRHRQDITAVAYSPDGSLLASSGWDEVIHLWDAKTGQSIRELTDSYRDSNLALAFSPDGRTLAAGLGDTIWLWDVPSGEQRLAIRKAHGRAVLSLAFLGKDTLISGGYRFVDAGKIDGQPSVRGVGELRFWDAASGKKRRDLTEEGADQRGCSLAVSRNGALLALQNARGQEHGQRAGFLPGREGFDDRLDWLDQC